MSYKSRWLVVCVGPLVAAASPTLAQTSGGSTLEEVVVTAEKVESSEQKTAVSMQVYTPEDLANRGAHDLQSLATSDPSITFAVSTGQPYIAMRGVSTGNVTETGNPSVAVATDGIFLNRSYSLNESMYDLDRVEILRGPQGTLYGRNAVGGIVNIITAKPTRQYESRISVEGGNFNTLNFEGMLNLPLSDTVAVRFAGASYFHDGYRDNSPNVEDGDDQNARSGRVLLSFEPTEHFKGILGFTFTRVDAVGKTTLRIPFEGGPGSTTPSHNAQNLGDPDAFPVYAPQFEDSKTQDFRWDFSYDGLPAGMTLSLLGGWNSIDWHHATPVPANPTWGWVAGGSTQNTSYFQNEYPETQSHELRLSSRTDQRLTWQTGLYYFKEKSTVDSRFIDNFGTTYQNDLITVFNFPRVESESKAVFAQTSFAASDTLKFTAGARYTKDSIERQGTFQLYRTITPGPGAILIEPNVNGSAESNKTTWTAGVDWNLSNWNLLYGKVSTGYKAGGFTGAGSYKPETLTAYEIGSKNRFAGDTLQLNAAAYYMEYTDQQLNQFSDPQAGAQTVNADSRIYGLEANLIALLDPIGRFELGVNYLDAEITGFVPPANFNPAVSASIVGNDVPMSPDLTASASFEHAWENALGGTIKGTVQAKYESSKYFSANNFASTFQNDNTVLNASVSYQREDSDWTWQLYGRNLTDETVLIDASEVYVANSYQYSFAPPRTYGIRVTANFK